MRFRDQMPEHFVSVTDQDFHFVCQGAQGDELQFVFTWDSCSSGDKHIPFEPCISGLEGETHFSIGHRICGVDFDGVDRVVFVH